MSQIISIENSQEENTPNLENIDQQFSAFSVFVNHHPYLYGLEKLSGKNITGGLIKLVESDKAEVIHRMEIHPLYLKLQEEQHLKMSRVKNIGQRAFYRDYLSKSIPTVFAEECEDWKMTEELQKYRPRNLDDYFLLKFMRGQNNMPVDYKVVYKDHPNDTFKLGVGKEKTQEGSFIKVTQHNSPKLNSFIQDLDYSMYNFDIRADNPLSKILRKQGGKFSYYRGQVEKIPKRVESEQYICVLYGKEKFKLVSPVFAPNIYVGKFDQLKGAQSPLNFFNIDFVKYPNAKDIYFVDATLSAGDCLYVPAYYYIQSQTLEHEEEHFSVMITQEYFSHSKLVDMVFGSIQTITQEKHQNDKNIENYLKRFFFFK